MKSYIFYSIAFAFLIFNVAHAGFKVIPVTKRNLVTQEVKQLIKIIRKQADVNARVKNYNLTLLISATIFGQFDVMQILLEVGADVNAVGRNGKTSLMFVAERGRHKSVDLLLKSGANPNYKNKSGETARSLGKKYPKVLKLLNAAGAK